MDFSKVDFVGDVHGQFDALEELLARLGYRFADQRWSHPKGRCLLFLGDLIDRGPQSRDVVRAVRALVEQGVAVCLMGNHEFNAVQYHTPDLVRSAGYIRSHTDKKNRVQHQAFLENYADCEEDLDSAIAWFSTLPVAFETPSFRAVHACWSPSHLDALRKVGNAWYLGSIPWVDAADESHILFKTIETLLKGPEVTLPNGLSFLDKGDEPRDAARVSWWKDCPTTWSEAVDPLANMDRQLDGLLYDGEAQTYSGNKKPVFFGHYWRTGEVTLDSCNAFCLDYSAGKDGHLTAYRFDESHSELSVDHVFQVKV